MKKKLLLFIVAATMILATACNAAEGDSNENTTIQGNDISSVATETEMDAASTFETIYQEGQYKVGVDIPEGEYIVFADGSSGYFCVSSDANGDDIINNENFDYNSIITVRAGQYMELSRCYAVPFADVKELDVTGTGMFKVGTHISYGEYKLTTSGSGYYCIYDDSESRNIVANDNFENSTYVYVEDGQYLLLDRCCIEVFPSDESDEERENVTIDYENGTFTYDIPEAAVVLEYVASQYDCSIKESVVSDTEAIYALYYNDSYTNIAISFETDTDSGLVNKIEASVSDQHLNEEDYIGRAVAIISVMADNTQSFGDALDRWSIILESDEKVMEYNGLQYEYYKDVSNRFAVSVIKDDTNDNIVEETESSVEKSSEDIIIDYYHSGDLDNARKYIEMLDEKSDTILSIEAEITNFIDSYGKWLGEWSYSKSNPKCSLTIKAKYSDASLVLCFEGGKTTAGKQIVYDLYEYSDNALKYHSDSFSAFDYTTLSYIEEGHITTSTYSSNTNNTTSEKDMYLIQ